MKVKIISTNKSDYPIFRGEKPKENTPVKKTAKISAMLTATLLALSSQGKAEIITYNENPSTNYTEEIEYYGKMIKKDPQNPILYQLRGDLEFKRGAIFEAIRNYAISTSKYIHTKNALVTKFKNENSKAEADKLQDEIEAYTNAIDKNMDRIRTFRKIKKTGFDYTKVRDYNIEETHQGQIQNCYFLTILSKFPDIIKKSGCLKWNDDGSAEVSLYPVKFDNAKTGFFVTGERKTYHISNLELDSVIFKGKDKNGKDIPFMLNPAQDITLKALEIGLIKNFDADMISCLRGGDSADAAKILFGSNIIPGVGKIITAQSDFDRDDIKHGIYINLPPQNGKYESGNCKPVNICGHNFIPLHTYIINEYNENNDTVSLSNPYYDDRMSKNDDIVIPFEEIIKNHFKLDFVIPEK